MTGRPRPMAVASVASLALAACSAGPWTFFQAAWAATSAR